MATIITWKILGTRCVPVKGQFYDVIDKAHWECYGIDTDGETYCKEAADMGEMDFTLNPEAPYIQRDLITDEIILNWIWSNGVDKTAVEADVQSKLNNQ